jgi:hypothetical protein
MKDMMGRGNRVKIRENPRGRFFPYADKVICKAYYFV